MKLLIYMVWISASFSVPAQTYLQNQFNKAEELYNNREYFDAITEYKRLLFFDKNKDYYTKANYKIGLSYKFGAKLDLAEKYLQFSLNDKISKENEIKIKIDFIRVNILNRKTELAISQINELSNSGFQDKDELNYWKGWAFMFNDNWDSASVVFSKIKSTSWLKSYCDSINKEKYSITFAKVISYILPGSGQFYSGNIESGLLSLGWNVLFGYLTLNAFISNRELDGIFIGELLWLRFYRGSIQNAEKFVIKRNKENYNNALKYLQFNYKGNKP